MRSTFRCAIFRERSNGSSSLPQPSRRCSSRLDAAEDFRFQAGQYVNLAFAGQDALTRPFSLANPPQDGVIELNIRHVPGGAATTYIHETLAVGESVTISGPYGRFFVRKSREHAVAVSRWRFGTFQSRCR